MSVDRDSLDRNHWVYRAYDEDGMLLYVGCTKDPLVRQAEHRNQSRWYRYATQITMTGPYTYRGGRAAERKALINEYPIYASTPLKQGMRMRRSAEIMRATRAHSVKQQGETDREYTQRYLRAYYLASKRVDAKWGYTVIDHEAEYERIQQANHEVEIVA